MSLRSKGDYGKEVRRKRRYVSGGMINRKEKVKRKQDESMG